MLLTVVAISTATAGCGFAKKPYGRDPLLRDGAGIWGNSEMAHGPDMHYYREPAAPHPPKPRPTSTGEWATANNR